MAAPSYRKEHVLKHVQLSPRMHLLFRILSGYRGQPHPPHLFVLKPRLSNRQEELVRSINCAKQREVFHADQSTVRSSGKCFTLTLLHLIPRVQKHVRTNQLTEAEGMHHADDGGDHMRALQLLQSHHVNIILQT